MQRYDDESKFYQMQDFLIWVFNNVFLHRCNDAKEKISRWTYLHKALMVDFKPFFGLKILGSNQFDIFCYF